MSDALKSALGSLLDGQGSVRSDALPIERLAAALAALSKDPARLAQVSPLLGDGVTGGLLYRTHPELVLGALEAALPGLDRAGRFALLASMLRMRPTRSEDLLRYVTLCLAAMGLTAMGLTAMGLTSDAQPVWETFSPEEHLIVYRWSDILRYATTHQTGEIAALLAERGIAGDGGHAWDVFQRVIGYRPTVLFTPRMSPALRHELESMQRLDWLDLPFMFGGAKATFTLDEIEDDSSAQNMQDGDRLSRALITQRSPSFDFFPKTFAWHPRQTLDHVRAIALERGFDIIEPCGFDLNPRRFERHELTHAELDLQARTVRAMARLDTSQMPVDVAFGFLEGEDGAFGALEFKITSSLKSDAKKYSVQIALGDPEAIVDILREHASWLTPSTLPLLLAKLFALSPSIRIAMPEGPVTELDARTVEAWDPSAELSRPTSTRALSAPPPEGILGTWRGQSISDAWPQVQPFVLTLESGEHGVRGVADTADQGVLEVVGSVRGGRLALRQTGQHGSYLIDARWNEEEQKLEGRWRQYSVGGTLTLEREAARVDVPAEELIARALAPWSQSLRFDVAALRFPGEEKILRSLFEDEHFRAAYVDSAANRATGADAMNVDSMVGRGATLLTRAMLPFAFRALDVVRESLGIQEEVRLFVHNDFTLNAFVTVDERVIDVHLTSGLLEVLDETELQAAIGHELGHVLLGTHDLALRLRHTRMSGDAQMRYFALRRHQELGADRISLLACADPRAVFVTQTMLRTGIRKRDLFGGVDSLIDNARAEVESLRKARKRDDLAFDSHPWSSLRTVALELFSQTEQFRALRPDAQTERSDRTPVQLDEELSSLAELLDVPQTRSTTAVDPSAAVAHFMALAALRIVEADQIIAARELSALDALGPDVRAQLEEILDWTHERRDVEILSAGRDVTNALSVPDREDLLGKLLTIVRADNVVQYAETGVVDELSRLVAVDTHSFRKTMEDLYRSAR